MRFVRGDEFCQHIRRRDQSEVRRMVLGYSEMPMICMPFGCFYDGKPWFFAQERGQHPEGVVEIQIYPVSRINLLVGPERVWWSTT